MNARAQGSQTSMEKLSPTDSGCHRQDPNARAKVRHTNN